MGNTAHGSADVALELYEQLLDQEWLEKARSDLGFKGGGGLFSSGLTMWLIVRQRLTGPASVEEGWLWCTPEEAVRLSPRSARAQNSTLSPHASGYDYARRVLPLPLVEVAADRLYDEALRALPNGSDLIFLLDGSSLTLDGSPELTKAYPPASCPRNGVSHWPVLRMVVAHELSSGLAVRPEWGPLFGRNATSEQGLALRVIDHLPASCQVVADRNFGVFSIAWALRSRQMLIRLTDVRAKYLLGKGSNLQEDVDRACIWQASGHDQKAHAELPPQAKVEGRLIVRHIAVPHKGLVRVCLFTNDIERSAEELVAAYTKRWKIETDLRSLKKTVGLEILRARTNGMLSKELILSVTAYNLIRVLMYLAAVKANVEPNRLSFSRACHCVRIYAGRSGPPQQILEEMLTQIAGRLLTHRPNRPKPPRHVWKRPHTPYRLRYNRGGA
jgi:putative transposase